MKIKHLIKTGDPIVKGENYNEGYTYELCLEDSQGIIIYYKVTQRWLELFNIFTEVGMKILAKNGSPMNSNYTPELNITNK